MNRTPPFSPLLYPSHKHSFLFHCFFSPFLWLFLIPSHFCPPLFSSFTPSLSSNLLSWCCPVLQLRQVKHSIRLTGTKTWAARVASTNFILLNDWFFNSFHGIFHNKTNKNTLFSTIFDLLMFCILPWPYFCIQMLCFTSSKTRDTLQLVILFIYFLKYYCSCKFLVSKLTKLAYDQTFGAFFFKIFNTVYDINNLVIHWFQYRSYFWLFPSHKRWMH